jgi:hypothetical protein
MKWSASRKASSKVPSAASGSYHQVCGWWVTPAGQKPHRPPGTATRGSAVVAGRACGVAITAGGVGCGHGYRWSAARGAMIASRTSSRGVQGRAGAATSAVGGGAAPGHAGLGRVSGSAVVSLAHRRAWLDLWQGQRRNLPAGGQGRQRVVGLGAVGLPGQPSTDRPGRRTAQQHRVDHGDQPAGHAGPQPDEVAAHQPGGERGVEARSARPVVPRQQGCQLSAQPQQPAAADRRPGQSQHTSRWSAAGAARRPDGGHGARSAHSGAVSWGAIRLVR